MRWIQRHPSHIEKTSIRPPERPGVRVRNEPDVGTRSAGACAVHTRPVGGVRFVVGPVSARLRRLVEPGNRFRLRGWLGVPWGAVRGSGRMAGRPRSGAQGGVQAASRARYLSGSAPSGGAFPSRTLPAAYTLLRRRSSGVDSMLGAGRYCGATAVEPCRAYPFRGRCPVRGRAGIGEIAEAGRTRKPFPVRGWLGVPLGAVRGSGRGMAGRTRSGP